MGDKLSMKTVTRCNRCIMDDSSDDTIRLDENGFCNYCSDAIAYKNQTYFPNQEGGKKLGVLISQLKEYGKDKKYDCIMGLSGGLDSSYLAYLGHQWGLRIIAVHVDDGFDTEISKQNLEKLTKATGLELINLVPDPEQFNALTKAYMKAGVPNLVVPQDNVLFACVYDYARKNKIKYFLSGANFALECILQRGNTYGAYDLVNILDIHKKFGERPIDRLTFMSNFKRLWDRKILDLQTVTPLDYMDYDRNRAFKELREFCGFEYYGRKHLENILTAFVQLYWFPKKFGVDKRTSHLSSMIASGQMTREQALTEYALPLYDEKMIGEYIAVIKEKLKISDKEFDEIMSAEPKQHTEYKTDSLYPIFIKLYVKLAVLKQKYFRSEKIA